MIPRETTRNKLAEIVKSAICSERNPKQDLRIVANYLSLEIDKRNKIDTIILQIMKQQRLLNQKWRAIRAFKYRIKHGNQEENLCDRCPSMVTCPKNGYKESHCERFRLIIQPNKDLTTSRPEKCIEWFGVL